MGTLSPTSRSNVSGGEAAPEPVERYAGPRLGDKVPIGPLQD